MRQPHVGTGLASGAVSQRQSATNVPVTRNIRRAGGWGCTACPAERADLRARLTSSGLVLVTASRVWGKCFTPVESCWGNVWETRYGDHFWIHGDTTSSRRPAVSRGRPSDADKALKTDSPNFA